MEQSQNVHVIGKVKLEALSEQVVAVKAVMSHKVSHPELRAVCSADCLSPT